ncbi:serine/threonine protein kinase, partial [Leptolyngbya sp. FACHB-36]|nr:serine/threonine protein kinase [Leptolyngbya sp. FACHB-36]
PLSPTQALAVMQQVCEVLGYLHQQSPSIVHQDLQPEHLVARSPAVGDLNLTVTGLLSLPELQLDTQAALGYRAPEQSLRQTSTASDLFALGPILVYLLTGKDPHSFYTQREQGFRFYPEYVPGLTPDLIAIVRRLTNPNPAERYRSSDEVAAALRQSNAEKL